MQIHPVHAGRIDWARAYEPRVNLDFAHRLYTERGWQPWTCARGAY